MKRRQFIKTAGAGLIGSGLLPLNFANSKSARRPNILLIESDSMDGRAMGCMGHAAAYTPNLDRLAEQGVLFNSAYCNSPQCVPSRSSMFSGKYTHKIEGWNNFKGIEKDDVTFLKCFEDAGYAVKAYGKTDYLSGGHSVGSRLNGWLRSTDIPFEWKQRPEATLHEKLDASPSRQAEKDRNAVKQALEFLKQQRVDQPFMAYVGLRLPHPAFETVTRWYEKIDPSKVMLPEYEAKLHPVMEYMARTKNSYSHFSEEEILNIRRTYFAMIAELDYNIGEIINAVDALKLQDNTYIIYISDHGEMSMEHRQWLKNSMYESSSHVPMIISGPDVEKDTNNPKLTSLIDIFPTLMDMGRLDHPQNLDGHSLMEELSGGESNRPDWVLSQYHSNFQNTGSFMLRQGDWKYVKFIGHESQLFNLKDDPDEMVNLAAQKPEVAKQLNEKLNEIIDCEKVDAKVKEYDKESFRSWIAEVGENEYPKIISGLAANWKPEYIDQISEWMNGA